MKNLFLSILTLIYMTVSSGIAMEIHFCMGERTGTNFYENSSDTCGRCGMKEKKGGCCSEEHKFVKLSEDHKISKTNFPDALLLNALVPSASFNIYSPVAYLKPSALPTSFADSGPLYISNRVFRI